MTRIVVRVDEQAPGAHVISWSCPDGMVPPGDLLLVDAARADARWRAVADVLVEPGSGDVAAQVVRMLVTTTASRPDVRA